MDRVKMFRCMVDTGDLIIVRKHYDHVVTIEVAEDDRASGVVLSEADAFELVQFMLEREGEPVIHLPADLCAQPIPRPPIIGFTGLAGSGKDTACDHLVDKHGFTKLAFADLMREMTEAINPYVDDGIRYNDAIRIWGYQGAKEQHPEMRRFLQRLGTEAGRDIFGENFWVNQTMARVDGPTCISDVRFLNEAAAIQAAGGIVVRLVRPEAGIEGDNGAHASETEMTSIRADESFLNDGTVENLHEFVDRLLEVVAIPIPSGSTV